MTLITNRHKKYYGGNWGKSGPSLHNKQIEDFETHTGSFKKKKEHLGLKLNKPYCFNYGYGLFFEGFSNFDNAKNLINISSFFQNRKLNSNHYYSKNFEDYNNPFGILEGDLLNIFLYYISIYDIEVKFTSLCKDFSNKGEHKYIQIYEGECLGFKVDYTISDGYTNFYCYESKEEIQLEINKNKEKIQEYLNQIIGKQCIFICHKHEIKTINKHLFVKE